MKIELINRNSKLRKKLKYIKYNIKYTIIYR